MRIDMHSHYMPEAILNDIKRMGDRCATPLEVRADGKIFIHTPERPYGPVKPTFYDLDLRLAFMQKHGIDKQVLVAPPFLFYYWSSTPEARELMKIENDAIAEVVRKHPDRFIGFGTVMLQEVKASVAECERAKSIGLRGIEIGSNVNDLSLADKQFWDFFEAAEALDMAIAIHPHNVYGRELMDDYHLRNLIGFPADTTLAAAKLIFSGLLDKFPRLRISLGQAGGFLPYIIGRLDTGYNARPECRRNISKRPSEYLRQFYYDSIIHSTHVTGFLIDTVGPDRLMLGTDFPFDMGAISPVADLDAQHDLTIEAREQINWRTANEFLRLGLT